MSSKGTTSPISACFTASRKSSSKSGRFNSSSVARFLLFLPNKPKSQPLLAAALGKADVNDALLLQLRRFPLPSIPSLLSPKSMPLAFSLRCTRIQYNLAVSNANGSAAGLDDIRLSCELLNSAPQLQVRSDLHYNFAVSVSCFIEF